ncbi:MAG: hypothetical protein VB055_10300 [Oscillospiraceae bacterium]|nr:hypothetical protein [Oscillospiraceae bacterium]
MRRTQLGSITVLFSVILLCVAVLAVLCLSTAKADLATAQNYADHVTQFYKVEQTGQQFLAQVDKALQTYGTALTGDELPDGAALEDGEISAVLGADGITLTVRLKVEHDDTYQILEWNRQVTWSENTDLTLW